MKNLLLNITYKCIANGFQLQRLIGFVILFALLKFNAVAAVFILSNLSDSVTTFGIFDYALSLGLLLTVPINTGLPGAYPYFILKAKETDLESVFPFHGWLLSTSFLVIYLLTMLLGVQLPVALSLAFLFAFVFALQILASVMLKSREHIFSALLFDAGFFILLNAYNAYVYYFNQPVNPTVLQWGSFIYLLILNLYFLKKANFLVSFKWLDYKRVVQFAYPLISTALLIVVLTGSARIAIENWIGMEAVGIYGLYFRLSAIVVLFHQIVNIAFFKRIYSGNPANLDKWFQIFLIFIAFVSFFLAASVPHLFLPYLDILKRTWSEYSSLYLILVFQMLFWICLALFENVIYREKLSSSCNKGFIVVFAFSFILLCLVHATGLLNLQLLAAINVLALFFACEWQMNLLGKHKIAFPKSRQLMRFYLLLFLFFISYLNLSI
jgi:hypothetical protein